MDRTRLWSAALVALVAGLVVGGIGIVTARPAVAACHRFSISASPARVSEGAKVVVTVSRDGNVAPSSVDVEPIDGTARAGQDYTMAPRTIEFTDDTTQTFEIAITNDSVPEAAETFTLRLTKPSGCAPNPNFIGDEAVVTIAASDAQGATAPVVSTTAQPPVRPATTVEPDDVLLAKDDDSSAAVIAAIVVALAVAATGFILWRRRMARMAPPR